MPTHKVRQWVFQKFGILRTGLPERIRLVALAEFTFRVPAHRIGFCKSDLDSLLQCPVRKTVYLFMAFRLGHLFTGNRLSPPSGLSAIQGGIIPPANKPIQAKLPRKALGLGLSRWYRKSGSVKVNCLGVAARLIGKALGALNIEIVFR